LTFARRFSLGWGRAGIPRIVHFDLAERHDMLATIGWVDSEQSTWVRLGRRSQNSWLRDLLDQRYGVESG